jgi:hypothetical protein
MIMKERVKKELPLLHPKLVTTFCFRMRMGIQLIWEISRILKEILMIQRQSKPHCNNKWSY